MRMRKCVVQFVRVRVFVLQRKRLGANAPERIEQSLSRVVVKRAADEI